MAEIDKATKRWNLSPRGELNPQPFAYEANALPLRHEGRIASELPEDLVFRRIFPLAFRADKAFLAFGVFHIRTDWLLEECFLYVSLADFTFHGLR